MQHAVVDASVIASWFLPDELDVKYETILSNIDKIRIHVPSIFEHEFINILLNAEKRRRLNVATALKILEIVSHYPITIEDSTAVLMDKVSVYKLAATHDLTAYDAAYLELAVRLGLPLITHDKLLSNTAKKLKLRTAL